MDIQSATLVADLKALTGTGSTPKKLKTLEPKGASPARRGRADYEEKSSVATGGIASPLQELDYSTREYHTTEMTIKSTDGLLSWKVKPIRRLVMQDANNAEVVMIYAAPPAETPTP